MTELEEILSSLKLRLEEAQSREEIRFTSARFCDDFYRLYRLFRNGFDANEQAAVQRFLAASRAQIMPVFRYFLQDLLNRIRMQIEKSYVGLEWIDVCELRSTFEALIEMYGDHLPVGLMFPDLDEIDAVDEQIVAKGEIEALIHPSLTPINFPEDHWWWSLEA